MSQVNEKYDDLSDHLIEIRKKITEDAEKRRTENANRQIGITSQETLQQEILQKIPGLEICGLAATRQEITDQIDSRLRALLSKQEPDPTNKNQILR